MQQITSAEHLRQWRQTHSGGYIVSMPQGVIHRAGANREGRFCPTMGSPFDEPEKIDEPKKGAKLMIEEQVEPEHVEEEQEAVPVQEQGNPDTEDKQERTAEGKGDEPDDDKIGKRLCFLMEHRRDLMRLAKKEGWRDCKSCQPGIASKLR